MDAAASIVSLIQFTIKGLDIIHKAFASVKEGHDTISVLSQNAADVLHILERLQSSPVILQSRDERLPVLIKACHVDVTRMAKKLENININENDSIKAKLWRSIKSAAKEKEWREFQMRLQEYSTRLMTFLTIEGSDKLFEMGSKVSSVREELKALVVKCENIETKCVSAGNGTGDLQLQSIINSVRQVIQDELSSQNPNGPNKNLVTDAFNETPTGSPGSLGVEQISTLVDERQAESGFAADTTNDIVNDIASIVEDVKRLTTEAAELRKSAVSARGNDGPLSQGFFLYRELRFSPDALRDLPIQPWQTTNIESNLPRKVTNQQSVPNSISSPDLPQTLEGRYWTVDDVMSNSRSLENFIAQGGVLPDSANIKPVAVNRKTLSSLIRWSQIETGPRTLWLKGRYMPQRGAENILTCVGLKLVSLAVASEIPTVSYFCQMEPVYPSQNKIAETTAMTSFLYSLIRQLLSHLPLEVSRTIDLSEKRFSELDGTKSSWSAALAIISEVVNLITAPVFCILDGVQWLEHESTKKYLESLWQKLQQSDLNLLITTTGTSLSLRDVLSREQTLTEEDLRIGGATEYLERHSERFWKKP